MQNKPKFFQPSTLIEIIIKLLILGGLCFFLWTAFSGEKFKLGYSQSIVYYLKSEVSFFKFLIVILLAPINLFFESNKWKVLVVENEKEFKQKQAIFSVLTGFAFSYLIPFGLGDLFGRSFHVDFNIMKNRVKSTLIAGGIQFFVALMAGTIALVYLQTRFLVPFWLEYLTSASVLSILIAVLLFLYFKKYNFQVVNSQFNFVKIAGQFFLSIAQTPSSILSKSLGYACLRYLVFSIQLVLMFQIMAIHLNIFDLTVNTILIFFAKSVIPTINAFGDLGVREASATFFFGFFGIGPSKVITATLVLWIINVLIPVVIGLFLLVLKVLRHKFSGK
jgi:uncharacterized membrane protein YbhN (UPF0104 family)